MPAAARRLATLALVALVAPTASAADILVGVNTPAARRVSVDQIDHSPFDALLRRHVNENGQVDYRGWKASRESMQALNRYIASLSTADVDSGSREGKLAYWINAYNAVTLEGMLRVYPTKSIRDHTAKLWGYNIWKNHKLRVDGQQVSLDSMEHEILRPMGEPRVHFAIVCASVGCPRLLNQAYVPERLEEQLDLNSRDFFSRSQNFQINARAKQIKLSSILDWFAEDFGSNQAALLRRISPWLPSDEARRLAADPNVRVSHLSYDWGINEQK